MKPRLIEKRNFADENALKVYVKELSNKYPFRIVCPRSIIFGEVALYVYKGLPRFTNTEGIKLFQRYAYGSGVKVQVKNYQNRLDKLEFIEQQASYTADR